MSRSLAVIDNKGNVNYQTFDDDKTVANYEGVSLAAGGGGRSQANYLWRDYSNLAPNMSGRPGLSRRDYEAFRPNEAIPIKYRDIIIRCDHYYYTVGLIRNTVDLMSDFGVQGLLVTHPNKQVEKFYRNWWTRVEGTKVSERFLNYLYRLANVIIKVQTAFLSKADREAVKKSKAGFDENPFNSFHLAKNELPWKYNFLHPATVDVVGGALASFVGTPQYAVVLNPNLRQIITSPKTPIEQNILKGIPKDVIDAATSNQPVLLDQTKTLVYHYKKDDWQPWAYPMLYSIMDDVIMLEKLKLADRCALDGAISNVRIFKLGVLDKDLRVAPTQAALNKLSSILEAHTGGGTLDIVWGPAIDLIESKSEVYKFLGEEKWKVHLANVYAGLGIPPTLTGQGGGGGTTNNYISLKTLIERLNYGRSILSEFWNEQFVAIQKSMGFRFPARIEYDDLILSDAIQEKALLVQLADRNLISDELLQAKFGNDPEMEKIRINRENKDRKDGRMVKKSGSFPDTYEHGIHDQLKKIALQSGVSTPSEVGLELKDKKKGEVSALDLKGKQQKALQDAKPKGVPGQGRPLTKKDSQKRKTKTFKPKAKALQVWAKKAQAFISENLDGVFLEKFGKSNFRKLSTDEADQIEKVKFGVLLNMPAFAQLNGDTLQTALTQDINVDAILKDLFELYCEQFGVSPTYEDMRELQKAYYTTVQDLNEEDEEDQEKEKE